MAHNADWLAGLKEGDPVVGMTSGIANRHGQLTTVIRFTPTQIVTQGGSRYRRKDGHGVGETGYMFTWIKEPTVERERAVKAEQTLRQVEAIRWTDVPVAAQEAVLSLVIEARATKAEKVKR